MTGSHATLYMVCGKIASGKSTLCAELASTGNAILISEDQLNAALYPDEMITIDDYRRCAIRLRKAMGPHVVSLLKAGISVALDFQANTLGGRRWLREIIDQSRAAHELHFLDVEDAICRKRLHQRNASGEHPYSPSDADFDLFNSYVVAPAPDEGFNVIVHRS